MTLLNIDGTDGPVLKQIFTCTDCKFLSKSTFGHYGKTPYKCYHDDIMKETKANMNIMIGDIGPDKITPDFCPFIVKKLRNEKLKEIYEANK